MSTTHTPGPWTFDESVTAGDFVNGPDGSIVADTFFAGNIDIGIANARLIAAAPELLDVLTRMVEQIADPLNAKHTLGAFVLGARIAEAREAIAKATGAA